MGIVGWRLQGVPIISFEELTGQPTGGIATRGKLIVFFPFPGQPKHQFFAIMSTSEPQPHTLNAADAVSVTSPVQSTYVAASINLKGTSVLIPNWDTLGAVVFPKMV